MLGVALVCGGLALLYLISTLHEQWSDLTHWAETTLRARPIQASKLTGDSPGACSDWPRGGKVERQASQSEGPTATTGTSGAGRGGAGQGRRQFRVALASGLLPVIYNYVTGFLKRHGADKEAGGMLVGDYSFDPATGVATFRIRGFVEAGPKVDFSAGSILFDADYQAQALRALQLEHPAAANLGCIHRHPGSLDVCSGGDAVTDREAVQHSDTKALVFAIITLDNARPGPSSLFYREFKIDFYLMAEETGFDYVPIQPVLGDLPLLEASPVLRTLVTLRGSSVSYDLAVLRQLPGLARSTLATADTAAGSGVVLTVSFLDAPETLHLWIQPGGGLCVALKDEKGDQHVLPGPWADTDFSRHIWLSHLVLLARERSAALHPLPSLRRHYAGLLQDQHRLVAEVRAMQERFGDRAVLRRRGDTLYWEYTVHESGRSFPIEIRYPATYPINPPEICSLKPLPPSPHQLGRNLPCWIDAYSGHSDWNPARDTAAICINAAHRWFACLLVYLTTGKWPEGADD